MKKENGITLVALIVSIIVLLILAGVTIVTLTGENGLITKADDAKQTSKEAEIKERIILAVTAAKTNNSGTLTKESLEEELTTEFGENNYELLIVGKGYIIIVDNVQYKVEKNGAVQEGNQIFVSNIQNAGDLSKGGQYNGNTEDTAYRITCIEDLLEWTKNANKYIYKKIKLENTIDFNSISSYKDYKAKTTDINENGEVEELITELTTGIGFKPISSFSGTFDGQENEIRNIYENTSNKAGLFLNSNNSKIKNLTITGDITSKSHVAGFVCYTIGNLNIENCTNKINIIGYNIVGGIVGESNGNENKPVIVKNCRNYGNLKSAGQAWAYTGVGGICVYNVSIIENCINYGELSGGWNQGGMEATLLGKGKIIGCKNFGKINGGGGILGYHRNDEALLMNNINYGEIVSSGNVGGIIGLIRGGDWSKNKLKLSVINCSNQGKVYSKNNKAGGIICVKNTICAENITIIRNCFNTGEVTAGNSNNAKSIIASVSDDKTKNYYHDLYNVYGAGDLMGTVKTPNYNIGEATSKTLEQMQSEEFVSELNTYVDNYNEEHKNDEDFIALKNWKYNEGSYPTFE